MDKITELKELMAEKIVFQEKIKEETKELKKLLDMPFYLRLQEPSQRRHLEDFKERNKEVFLGHSVKKWSIPKEEGLELFNEFFTEFLKGEVKSIYDFLKGRGYKIKKTLSKRKI